MKAVVWNMHMIVNKDKKIRNPPIEHKNWEASLGIFYWLWTRTDFYKHIICAYFNKIYWRRRKIIPRGGSLPVTPVNLGEAMFLSDATTPLKRPRFCPSKPFTDHKSSPSSHSNLPTLVPNLLSTPNEIQCKKSHSTSDKNHSKREKKENLYLPGSWHNALDIEFMPGTPTYLLLVAS